MADTDFFLYKIIFSLLFVILIPTPKSNTRMFVAFIESNTPRPTLTKILDCSYYIVRDETALSLEIYHNRSFRMLEWIIKNIVLKKTTSKI